MTRVVIVARTHTLRAGLRALVESADVQVVGEAASVAGLGPHLPDYDVLLVGDDSLLADLPQFAGETAGLAVVALSDDDRSVETLSSLPVDGWAMLSPDASPEELRAAVEAASRGMVVLPAAPASRLLARRSMNAIPLDAAAEPLTAREQEVLNLLSQGLSNKLIARALGISEHTVKYHVSSVFAKLGASSRTDAISRGARQGLITL